MDKVKVAIVSLLILEGIALIKGIDGVALTAVVALISGLGGFEIGKILSPKSTDKE